MLTKAKADIINVEQWGLKKMAYPIQNKSTGFYNLVEFAAAPETIQTLETEFRRDESVMRFLTTVLDSHALEYNVRRRKGEFNRNRGEKKVYTRKKEGAAV